MMRLTPSFSITPFYIMTMANFLMEAMDIYGLMFQIRSLRIVSLVLRNIYYIIPFISAFKWIREIHMKYQPILRETRTSKWIGTLKVDEYAGIFSLSLTLCGVLFQAFQPLYGNANGVLFIEDYTSSYVIAYTVLMIFSTFVGTIIPNRIFNYKAYILRLELEHKRELVKHAAHEIRTPLNTIGMGLTLMKTAIKENDEYLQGLVRDIEEANHLAVGILTDLLNYEKIASQQMQLDLSKVPPLPFLMKILRPFTLNARAKNIELNCNYDEDQLENLLIDIDEGKMGQVVRNLISNAIKFSSEGGVVKVNVRVQDYEWLRVEVMDCGPGISSEDQCKLFHEVAQFNPNAHQGGGGSGVGLWISKKIVDMHGARINIHSEVGVGSTFTLDIKIVQPQIAMSFRSHSRVHPDSSDNHRHSGFEALLIPLPHRILSHHPFASIDDRQPRVISDDHASPPLILPVMETTPSHLHSKEIGNRKYNIMIVDDSKVNRVMLTRLLTSMGHSCYDACDGAAALNLYQECLQKSRTIDVVLMDSHMPIMSGSEATLKLRELGFTGVIIGVTGDVIESNSDDPFLNSGVDAIMTKPVDANRLEEVIHHHILNQESKRNDKIKEKGTANVSNES